MNFTKRQQNWAEQHDWCLSVDEDRVEVEETTVTEDEYGITCDHDTRAFYNFKELYNWDGY